MMYLTPFRMRFGFFVFVELTTETDLEVVVEGTGITVVKEGKFK